MKIITITGNIKEVYDYFYKAELELKNKIDKIAYDDPSVDFQMYLDQFYKDLKASEKEFLEHKSAVEEVMKSNSVDYALELVGNQRRSYYEEVYEKGYTLNLIVKKIES